MTKPRMCVLVAAFLILCAAAGCGSSAFTSSAGSSAETFLAVDVPEIGGPNGLTAKVGVADYSLATVSLPVDILADAPDDMFLALRAEGITVAVDGEAAGRPNPSAKAQEHVASVTFRLAEPDIDACGAPGEVGPFALTITDGLVTLDRESAALDSRAQLLVRAGRFEVCAETRADFDGSIALGSVSFEFGRLRGGEERVVLCHIPPVEEGDAHTITVGSSAVAAHLAHGDYLGECQAGDDDGDAPDSDGDGVSDDADQCPATPADEVADEAGCSCAQRDGDGDGVNDCGDACPNSATGAAVDGTGCTAADFDDDDGDGVSNGTDDCPGTANGDAVNDAGCSCAQRDGDADGVNDCDDACPNSERGADVDDTGCAVADLHDDDGDGVNNGADDCPGTANGEAVDEAGCSCAQRDGDADGVNDCDDACPNSESEADVDETGCDDADLHDDDGDGVNNGNDACPDTPTGEITNAVGCSCSQRDADSDGVDDCGDACANTGAGLSVNANGCAANQLDDDSDGLANDADACANTPASATVDATGCSCSQKDADSDGVDDCNDKCANTGAGLSVNANGCAANQLDDDGDGVTNDADACANTASGTATGVYGCPLLVAHAGDDATIASNGTATLGGTPAAGGGDGTYTYAWTPATGLSASTTANPTFTATAAGTLTFTLTVTDGHGATASDSVVITVQDAAPAPIASLSVGSWHNAVLLTDGTIRTWGWDSYGQLGDGSLAGVNVDPGSLSTLVAKADGTAWAFGYGIGGAPAQVAGASGVVQVGSLTHGGLTQGGLLLTSGGTVLGFNSPNNNCEMGGTQYAAVTSPTPIPGLPTDIVAISAGANHSVALGSDGRAWVWGWVFGCTPWTVLDNVTAVAAGDSAYCLFLRGDGTVWSMGFNLMGQLGNGTRTSNYTTPSQVSGLTGVAAVAAGDRHSMFLKGDGTLWTCGWATEGRLGLSDAELAAAGSDLLYGKYLTVPKQVGLAGVAMIGGGQIHSVAVLGDGTVWAWGNNGYGQLSNGTGTSLLESVPTPAQIDIGQ